MLSALAREPASCAIPLLGIAALGAEWLFSRHKPSGGTVWFWAAAAACLYFAEEIGNIRERLDRLSRDVSENRKASDQCEP